MSTTRPALLDNFTCARKQPVYVKNDNITVPLPVDQGSSVLGVQWSFLRKGKIMDPICLRSIGLVVLLLAGTAGAQDRDLDNDGVWDYEKGGIDRDTDNDGIWDYDKGGIDRDLDNDGTWDKGAGGIDRDTDNDGTWDRDAGGIDRDLDDDNQWDE
ncbi:hypothetical protein [Pseudomonas sp. N040]|uniref:hypothetical protein n=1 Tax=Pseudomonas sp. N040 TaxID=2785325 RepID=UPI001E588F7C|nr:hypothetical protein [Pseudomonas sp. N040]